MIQFDPKLLATELVELLQIHRSLLATCCVERLAPSYERMCRMDGLSSWHSFRQVLDYLWDEPLRGGFASGMHSESVTETLFIDGEDCKHAMADVGFRAVGAIDCAVRSAINGDPKNVARALGESYVAARQFGMILVREQNPGVAQQEARALADAHPLVQRELARQKEDLELIKATPIIDESFVEQLRAKQMRQDLLEGYI